MISVRVDNRKASAVTLWPLTSGSVGIVCTFSFSDEWEDLTKTAVFRGSGTTVNATIDAENTCTVPADVLALAGDDLYVGVYGESAGADGTVIPTVWSNAGYIYEGAAPAEENDD